MMSSLVLLLAVLADNSDGGMQGGRGRGGPPPIVVPTWAEATWYGTPREFVEIRTRKRYATSGMRSPALSTWYGADRWSSTGKNRHSVPGRRPGDVLYLAGEHDHFRLTRSWDLNMPVIEENPTRWVSDDRTYTYLWGDGTLRLGLNNRDRLKGVYVLDDWYRWGADPQTWVVGGVDDTGYPTTRISGGRTYLEWAGAASFAHLELRGPTGRHGTEAILQTENHYVHDSRGNKRRQAKNWPQDPGAIYGEWQGLRDIELVNVHITDDGGWGADGRWSGGEGSKWGCLTYRVGRSSRGPSIAGWRWHGGSVTQIRGEHCLYFHNVQGMTPKHMAVHLKDLELGPAARTAVQFSARESEGPNGCGGILLEDLTIRDVGLEQGGGGSALTFAGNHDGRVVIRRVDCWLGSGAIQTDSVTGGFVCYAGKGSGGRPPRSITIEDSVFRVGPLTGRHSARRPNLQVGDVRRFTLRSAQIHQADGAREAVAFGAGIGTLTRGENDIRGDVLFGSQRWRDVAEDGWDTGLAWALFMEELRSNVDTNGDGILAGESGVVGRIILE